MACAWQEDGLGTAGGGGEGGKEGGGDKGEGGGGEGGGIGDCGGGNGGNGGNCGDGGGDCPGTLGGASKSDEVPSQVASSSKSQAAQWHGPNGIPPTNARSVGAASWQDAPRYSIYTLYLEIDVHEY